jgi:phytoene synthase
VSRASRPSDHAVVRGLARRSRSNFYYAFLFLPRPQRRAITAVYAFCRSVDDAVDAAPDPGSARRRIEWWRRELAACFGEGVPSHPISRDLAEHAARARLSREPLEEVIRGVEMDLAPPRYDTFEELAVYCRRVASAVGHSCIEIFESRGEASRRWATTLGIAFQLTNILRDLRADCARGRCYLPAEEMRRFGYSAGEAAAGRGGAAFRALMDFQCARALELFARSDAEFPASERSRLYAGEIMGAIYRKLLERIAARPEAVLEGQVGLPRPLRLAIAAGVFARSRLAP